MAPSPILENLNIFNRRTKSEIDALTMGAEERRLNHRETLFQMGDPARAFAVVTQGALKLVRTTPEGNDVIVFFATPGNVIGGLLMTTPNSVYPISAVAMGPAKVLKIPRETWNSKWVGDSQVQQHLSGMFYNRMSQMHDHLAMARARLPQKVAAQMVALIEQCAETDSTAIPIPITRQEIADAVGASVESVIRVMSEWSQSGIIETTDQHIHICRMDKILEIVKGDHA